MARKKAKKRAQPTASGNSGGVIALLALLVGGALGWFAHQFYQDYTAGEAAVTLPGASSETAPTRPEPVATRPAVHLTPAPTTAPVQPAPAPRVVTPRAQETTPPSPSTHGLNQMLVMNALERAATFRLTFPSGAVRELSLESGESIWVPLPGTGEGPVRVYEGSRLIDEAGYFVQGANRPSVLTIMGHSTSHRHLVL